MKNFFINNKSIKTRFLATLFINIARIGLGFISGIVIARGLGPADYGNYNFLLGSFGSITALLDMGTPTAFYTFLSQKKRGMKFYIYYFLWTLIQFLVILSLIAVIFPGSWLEKIWLGHKKGMIVMAFMASFMMNKVWQIATYAGESIRATIIVQLHNIIIAGLYLCLVFIMFFLQCLSIQNIFIIIALIYFLLSFLLMNRLKADLTVKEKVTLSDIINEFKAYCAPLVFYSIAGFFYSFADMWLLQKFGGAVQQGFYSIGLRFSSICLIATTSILQVFWKEIAEANASGNRQRLYYLYTRISRALCFIGAAGACFLIPFSREILIFLFGSKYETGWLCLAVMFLYPVHQSLGQINGTYFFASAQTRLYTKIGIFFMIISIPTAYFLLAPSSGAIKGLGLNSTGMALKMVILQAIGVNVSTYYISRVSGWKFSFLYQFGTIGLLLFASFAIKIFLMWFFNTLNVFFHPLVVMVFCAPFYILAVGLVLYLFPGLSGLEKREVLNFLKLKRI